MARAEANQKGPQGGNLSFFEGCPCAAVQPWQRTRVQMVDLWLRIGQSAAAQVAVDDIKALLQDIFVLGRVESDVLPARERAQAERHGVRRRSWEEQEGVRPC